jgi:hypothetical protein
MTEIDQTTCVTRTEIDDRDRDVGGGEEDNKMKQDPYDKDPGNQDELTDWRGTIKTMRLFKPQLKILKMFGIHDYDDLMAHPTPMMNLHFDVKAAIETCKRIWKTNDLRKIKILTKMGITREMIHIEGRKDAKEYGKQLEE